jgi:hypothetical protein
VSERLVVPQRRRPARRRRRGRLIVWIALVLAGLAVAFVLGQAIANGPAPAGTQTIERTVRIVTVTVRR